MDHPSSLLFFFLKSSIDTQGTTVLIFIVLFLLFFSFMLSGAEVAFFSLTHKDVNLLKTKQHHSYKRIIDLLEHPKILLGSLLIANSLINISIIIISNILIDEFFTFNVAYLWIKFLIKVVVVTFIIVLFGEVIPKVMATQNNVRFAKEVGGVVEFVNYLFKRISGWLVKYSNVIEHRLTKKSSNAFTNEELFHAIEITDPGSNENEKNILKGILKFKDITVKQIMKTRLDVHGVDYDLKFDELIKHVEELHYSRLPVYKESLDEITGMIQTKDLLPFLEENKDFDWHTLIRSPYFVHEQKLIEDLLREFQSKHTHFAIVVDEFGGTSGIVTLEDILEEIIGDIKDEFDDEDSSYKKLDDHNYIFDGKTMINDVCRIMGLEDNTFETLKGESDSLAGLVLEIAGDIPKISQVITSGDFEFTVMEAEKNRIQKIKVTIKQPTSEA